MRRCPHAIARTSAGALERLGHAVITHDLYAEKFDPVLPGTEIARDAALAPVVKRHCDELADADGIVVVHPNWWGQPPAILKGWIDRVVRPGIAYAFQEGDGGEGVPLGLLRARTAIVFNTSNTPADRERDVFRSIAVMEAIGGSTTAIVARGAVKRNPLVTSRRRRMHRRSWRAWASRLPR